MILNKGPAWRADRAEQSTSTFYAQGGVAVVTVEDPLDPGDPADSVDLHLTDTLAAGAGLTDPVAARPILADGYDAVWGLMQWGADFDRAPTDCCHAPAKAGIRCGASSTPAATRPARSSSGPSVVASPN